MREPLSATNFGYAGFSMPQSEFRRREHIGRNLLDHLFKTGEVDSVVIGQRIRHIILPSWSDYVARRLAGIERDPAEKARAIEAYRASVARSKGGKATALARSGWGKDHGRAGGSKHVTSRAAAATQRVPPPAADVAPKSRSTTRKNDRKENATNL
jgi:hypothetical protein